MSPLALVFVLFGGLRRWLSSPCPPLVPRLDDDHPDVLDPDAALDLELRLRTTQLYWLLVRAAQHAGASDGDDEDAARAVMAEIELNAAKVAVR